MRILVISAVVLLGTMEQRPKVVRHCFDVCGVAQHAEDTPGLIRQTLADNTKCTGGVCAT